MKELHEILDEIRRSEGMLTIHQLLSLCNDTKLELSQTVRTRDFTKSVMTLKTYYGMDKWTYENVHNLGKFLKHGDYKKVLDNYKDVV